MKGWYQSLSERERWMVMAVGAAVVIFLFYMLIVNPLQSANSELTETVTAKQSDYDWMLANAADAKSKVLAGPAATSSKDSRTLIARVTAEMRAKKIQPKGITPRGESRLNVTFERVVFVDLMERLEYLHTRFNIRADKVSIEPAGDPGMVNVQLTLAR